MSDGQKISVSKKALRRLLRKHRAKCQQLEMCQRELREIGWAQRAMFGAINYFANGVQR